MKAQYCRQSVGGSQAPQMLHQGMEPSIGRAFIEQQPALELRIFFTEQAPEGRLLRGGRSGIVTFQVSQQDLVEFEHAAPALPAQARQFPLRWHVRASVA
ncbi:conserved hypothetical protein [endosymbiont of unidentified scaly snail isolate Monju]|nr:conserved hypothetical protein [endosymbiont of unidentified scaly snail isolate Monju]